MKESRDLTKFYVYISESKVEMLYSQIPWFRRHKLSTELTLKLPFLENKVGFPQKSTLSKLNKVLAHIEKHSGVGSIEAPKEYFRGNILMKWAHIHPGIVFFGGVSGRTRIGLGGSLKHLIGYNVGNTEPGISHTPWLVSLIIRELGLDADADAISLPTVPVNEEQNRVFNSISFWSNELSKVAEIKFEFLAKKILIADHNGETLLLGTPLYVALGE